MEVCVRSAVGDLEASSGVLLFGWNAGRDQAVVTSTRLLTILYIIDTLSSVLRHWSLSSFNFSTMAEALDVVLKSPRILRAALGCTASLVVFSALDVDPRPLMHSPRLVGPSLCSMQ